MMWQHCVRFFVLSAALNVGLSEHGNLSSQRKERALAGDFSFHARNSKMWRLFNAPRWDDLWNKFQFYLLHSAAASADTTGAEGDLFLASLSNMVVPSVCYAYFTADVDWKFDSGSHGLNVGASASGMATVFTKLFQFTDNDKDGKYTADVDDIVDEYQLWERGALGYPDPKPVWASGEHVDDEDTKVAKIKTEDGVFGVILKANQKSGYTPGGASLTPMNTKVDVEINYPNLQPGNKVGLETHVVSTKAEATAGVSTKRGFYVDQPGDLSSLAFTWDTEADLPDQKSIWNLWSGSGKVAVKASAAATAALGDIQGNDFIKANMGGGANLEVSKIVFAFDTSQAGKVLWDPTVGVGSQSDEDKMASGAYDRSHWAIASAIVGSFFMSLI